MSDTPEQIKERARQTAERESFKRRLAEDAAVRKVFADHPTKFRATQEQVLQSIGTIQFRDGIPYSVRSGKILAESLNDYAVVNSHAVAQNWQEAARPEEIVKSKSDLKDASEKSAYITQFGYDKFAALPATAQPPVDLDNLTWSQYKSLPASERSRLIGIHGPYFPAKLQAAHREQEQYNRLIGIPTGKSKK